MASLDCRVPIVQGLRSIKHITKFMKPAKLTKVRRTSSDPGRALLTGFVGGPGPNDDSDKFDVPGLRGIRATAPYFHNNSAAALEDVVDHYVQFFKRVEAIAAPGVVSPVASTDGVHFDRIPRPEERAALLAYLRKL
jgi:cytochrome c peroxidase